MKVRDVIKGGRVVFPGSPSPPTVSIVLPTYRRNGEGLLARCIESALRQTFSDIELVIIDDGSSDGSEETITRFAQRDSRVVYIRHDVNSGLPAVRTNEGVLRARGRAVAFLFDDNVYQPDFIERAWSALSADAELDVVHTNVEMLTHGDQAPFVLGGWPLTLELLRNLNTIPNGGVLCRREFFDRYGLYDPHLLLRRVCDWDLWFRALKMGARFGHIEYVSSTEHGLVSPNSIGNTITWDVKTTYGYMMDEELFESRSSRLTPSRIGEFDVLDPSPILPYVRDETEWSGLLRTVYEPFLARHDSRLATDLRFQSNRAASVHPAEGWNAPWSVFRHRRRALIVTNAVSAWASTWRFSLKKLDGMTVLFCPEWQLSAFQPDDIDLLIIIDGCAAFIHPYVQGFADAKVPIVYSLAFGGQSALTPMQGSTRLFAESKHIAGLLGAGIYFPQTGRGFSLEQWEGARGLMDLAHVVIDESQVNGIPELAQKEAIRGGSEEPVELSVAYDLEPSIGASERVTVPGMASSGCRAGWESASALAEARRGSRLGIPTSLFNEMPRNEQLGLAVISEENRAPIYLVGEDRSLLDVASAKFTVGYLSNIARTAALARALVRLDGPLRWPRVALLLNSDMVSGSEMYGLMLARNLAQMGVRVRVLIPRETPYGSDGDVAGLNAWLLRHGLNCVERATYHPGISPRSSADSLSALRRELIGDDPPDLIIASGHIPVVADLNVSTPVFMALFQPSAYEQSTLIGLRGKLAGLMSDCKWSLESSARVLGTPAKIVRSTFPIESGASERLARPARSGVSIAVGGTLQPRKRQLEAVRALAILHEAGYKAHLKLYGYALDMLQAYVAELDQLVIDLGLQDYVTRLGMSEMSVIAEENDIVLSASIDESLPQTLAELMRLGCIGVAGLSGGIDELIIDGETGYLTSDLGPSGLADCLMRALDGAGDWDRIRSNARTMVENVYGSVATTRSLLELLNEGAEITRHQRGVAQQTPSLESEISAIPRDRSICSPSAPSRAFGQGVSRPAFSPPLRVVAIGEAYMSPVQLTLTTPFEHMEREYGLDWELYYQEAPPPYRAWSRADLVIGMRVCTPAMVRFAERVLAAGVPFVFMNDDDFETLDPESELGRHYAAQDAFASVQRLVQIASANVVFSPGLHRKYQAVNPRTHQLPALAGVELFDAQPAVVRSPEEAAEIRIGYSGSPTHDRDVSIVEAVLRQRLELDPRVVVESIGQPFAGLEGHPRYRHFPGTKTLEGFARLQHSRDWDIGLAPMAPTPSNLAKTDNKYRTYGAAGVAGVYTRLEPYEASVRDGVTGLLVDNEADAWSGALDTLIVDPTLRTAMARAARRDVRERYSLDVVGQTYAALFTELRAERKAASPIAA